MSDDVTGENHPTDVVDLPDGPAPLESVEAYESARGLVLYDAENPLAWVLSSDAVRLDDRR
ncbi:MAG: hypothetical protein ABEJ55_06140 [Halanaeroarchaeum sp.]